MTAVGTNPYYVASNYARSFMTDVTKWVQEGDQWVLAEAREVEPILQKAEQACCNWLKSVWNGYVVTRWVYLEQAVDQGLLKLPGDTIRLIWSLVYGLVIGLAYVRSDGPDAPREKIKARWNDEYTDLSALGYGLLGTLSPWLAVKVENTLNPPKNGVDRLLLKA